MTGALVAGVVAGYGVALPVGAVATYLVALGAREPLRTAAAAAAGVATTDGLFAVVAVAGGAGLARFLRPVSEPLTRLAAVVLAVMAVRTVVTAVHRYRTGPVAGAPAGVALGPLRAYAVLLALTALNPTTVVYFGALVLGGQADGGGWTASSAVLFAVGAFLASASWQLVLAGGGAMLGRTVTAPRGRLAVAVVSGAIMTALAGALLSR